jgi:UDP-N-acetyl-2-amino-2-deoxyglucuronate dehydrogenase
MAKQWRCAVVGVGTVGDWHVRVIPQLGCADLVAVCDLVPENARKALDKYQRTGVPIYTDQAEMLRKEDIDVVHICTPSGDHLDPAVVAMDAGKHVICEKPLEINLERIDRMIAAADRNKVRLAGIFQNRWNPANRALRDAVQEGRFGRLAWAGSFTPWYRSDEYYRTGGWRGTWKLDGGGAIMNQSVHGVDLLQWIAGPVKTVSAFASSRIHAEIEVEDTLTCALQFESGAHGTIVGTTAMWPGQAVRVEVGGEFGTAVSEGGLRTFTFKEPRPADVELLEKLSPGPGETLRARLQKTGGEALLEQLGLKKSASTGGGASAADVPLDMHGLNMQSIFRAWSEGRDAETSGREARKAVAIIVAVYESARNGGRPTPVES